MRIKLGTRSSKLALWQAYHVKDLIESSQGADVEIVSITSSGEKDLKSPLYDLGIQGIFTKELDIAVLNGEVDMAVHSLKDVPTRLANGLCLASVPVRGTRNDVVLYKDPSLWEGNSKAVIATSSLRRKSQWLRKFPLHEVVPIRGNIQTRLQKFADNQGMDAMIMAQAGLERLDLRPDFLMRPLEHLTAPAQGALGAVCLSENTELVKVLESINHTESHIACSIERSFLQHLEGGCTMPIAAHASFSEQGWTLKGEILSLDGQQRAEIVQVAQNPETLGNQAAQTLLEQGGKTIFDEIRRLMK